VQILAQIRATHRGRGTFTKQHTDVPSSWPALAPESKCSRGCQQKGQPCNSRTILTPSTNGQYQFLISAAPQQSAGMNLKFYTHEVRATLASGSVSVQNSGILTLLPSAFVNFPPQM